MAKCILFSMSKQNRLLLNQIDTKAGFSIIFFLRNSHFKLNTHSLTSMIFRAIVYTQRMIRLINKYKPKYICLYIYALLLCNLQLSHVVILERHLCVLNIFVKICYSKTEKKKTFWLKCFAKTCRQFECIHASICDLIIFVIVRKSGCLCKSVFF